ncbi:DUF362 domain-containing protein [Candidatus Woesearchaeota archaeon]|nr:DUF362 domain-containing protein [Candidatus Woesearchaeota archaeon]
MAEIIYIKEEGPFLEELRQQLDSFYKPGQDVAIKVHVGEKHNKFHIKADFVKKIVAMMKELGLKPFVFESVVVYAGGRDTVEKCLATAKEHGYSEENLGCPMVVDNDYVEQKTEHFTIQVCRRLAEADGILVLSHFKGHDCSGIGGAIKNLCMGFITPKSKEDVHDAGYAVLDESKCTGCGICEKSCPFNLITMEDSKPKFKACYGCEKCILNCPEKALSVKTLLFDCGLAEAARAAVAACSNLFYVNVMNNVTKHCDCSDDAGPIIAKDAGFLLGTDPVAIDKASHDIIVENEGKDVFKEAHGRPTTLQIKHGEKIGLGEQKYELVRK